MDSPTSFEGVINSTKLMKGTFVREYLIFRDLIVSQLCYLVWESHDFDSKEETGVESS